MNINQNHPKQRMVRHFQKENGLHVFRVFAVVFLAMALLVGSLCYWFYGRLQQTIREESNGYLQEIAVRISNNIDRIIDDTYAMLYSVEGMIPAQEGISFGDFNAISSHQQQYWKYQSLFLIDHNGNAYTASGKALALSGDVYLRNAVLDKKASMSPLQIVDGKECSIFAIPLDRRMVGGIEMSALAVTYDVQTFAQVLSMSAFSNQAYSHLVSQDGTIIIRSNSTAGANFGYNILSSIENSGSVSAQTMEELRRNVSSGKNGQIEFSLDERKEYMVYCPIQAAEWVLFTFVPVAVVNAKSGMLLGITFLLSGFVTLSFAALVVVLLTSFHNHQRRLEQIAYVDQVTGGNTIGRFYELAGTTLAAPGHLGYALVYSNFGKFKVLNETFGRPVCDEILKRFYEIISATLTEGECIGRMAADNFCLLMRSEGVESICERLESWYDLGQDYINETHPVWSLPLTEFGIYVIENDTMPFPLMVDRAKLALREIPRSINAKLRYAIYNDEVRSRLFREKRLDDMMEGALTAEEFRLYLQPKYRVSDEKIVGAEALTRWVSHLEGTIFPDEFIPLFEKNGFIIQMDLFIFERTCQLISQWIEQGREPIKISVNCSRIHLRDQDFLRNYRRIASKHNVPFDLIEIELTESIVLEDMERFKQAVEEIREAGFRCSMDDFGSGYSSLNMIQDISVDTLKIDKVFFRNAMRDPVRTESVVSNIIGMAQALSMETVAEGVERPEQVEMLRRIGCDIIQGYVFAKPMPVADFEALWIAEEKQGEGRRLGQGPAPTSV